jgi:hypothetical protein
LKNYIASNAVVSGGRWRCASCETFVSLYDLQYCGFTADILRELRDVATSSRHRVQLRDDGTYTLLEESARTQKALVKRQSVGAPKAGVVVKKPRMTSSNPNEVIDIL